MYPYELEKGSKKYACPQCGAAKKFRRVIETATGHCLPDHVGRCDRESSCGYEYTWKDYLADNRELAYATSVRKMSASKRIPKLASIHENGSRGVCEPFSIRKPDYLDRNHLLRTLIEYDQNTLVQFLLNLFPNDPEAVYEAVRDYLIGTKDGFTVFPTISKIGKVCKAKLMKFDQATGKRIKDDYSISSLQAKLKTAGLLRADFETDKDVFFGEHLLRKREGLPIAIVEAEKTAVIASICKGAFPSDFVWLATGSKQWLKAKRIRRLGRHRTIILYPDADGFEKWQETASEARKAGYAVKVSNLIDKRARAEEKSNGADLADYLIREQRKRNDPAIRESFLDLIEERLAIMTIDGGLTDAQAEAEILESGFYADAIRNCGASEKA